MAVKLTLHSLTLAEHFKDMALLLLIHCLLLAILFCVCGGRGGGHTVGSCYVVHYLVSSFAIISLEKKESWLFYFNCLLMLFDN